MRRFVLRTSGSLMLLAGMLSAASDPEWASVDRKLGAIEDGTVLPHSTVVFTASELNAWARVEIAQDVPEGIRQPRLTFGQGTATGSALVDFLKLRQVNKQDTGWLMTRLIEGERPVSATVKLQSRNGQARVDIERVELSGVAATGSVLDFLISTFFMPRYPDAKIGQWFDLDYNVEGIEIQPGAVRVRMK